MENKRYTKEELIFMSVHELRAVARDVGVRSPSNKKKNDLIDIILAIADKRKSPEFNMNKVGRPPIDSHPNSHIPYSETSSGFDGFFTLNSNIIEYGVPTFDEKRGRNIKCILDFIEGGIGVVRRNYFNSEKIYLPKNIIASDKLKEGDIIFGKEELSPDKQTWVVICVKGSESYEIGNARPNFDELNKIAFNKFGNNNIIGKYNVGDSYYITCSSKRRVREIAEDILKCSAGLNFAINYNTTNESTKDFANILDINFALDEESKLRSVKLMLKHIKRQVEMGEDVTLVFSGFSEYFRSLDIANKKQITNNILLESVQEIRKIAGMSGNFEKGSLTIFFVDSLTVPENYKEIIKYDVISNLNNSYEI